MSSQLPKLSDMVHLLRIANIMTCSQPDLGSALPFYAVDFIDHVHSISCLIDLHEHDHDHALTASMPAVAYNTFVNICFV